MSLTAEVIDQHNHDLWFSRLLTNTEQFAYVGILAGNAVGWVRFDPLQDSQTFRANIVIAPENRGQRIGASLLALAIAALCAARPGVKIEAQVKRANPASLRLFTSYGFISNRDDEEVANLRLSTADVPAGSTRR